MNNLISKPTQVYFEYLDALRFLAFLGVFYAHIGTIYTGTTVSQIFPINILLKFTVYGSYGVNFFFVLSGFLITYLLLRERLNSGIINIRKFYAKRILRIWPVYFITFITGVFILPLIISPSTYEVFKMADPNMPLEAIFYNLFFSGNFYQGLGLGMASLSIGILWSVCIEEQFYFIWPWIVKFFSSKRLVYIISLLISLSLLYKFLWAEDRMANYYLPWSLAMDLGFGSLLGAMYFNNQIKIFLKIIAGTFIASIVLIFFTPDTRLETLRLVKTPILDSIFAITIIFFIQYTHILRNISKNIVGKAGIKLKNIILNLLTDLGKISYGLYAYHTICLMLTIHLLFQIGFLDSKVSPVEFYAVAIIAFTLTIISAKYSHKFVEKKILRLRDKF